MRKAFLFSAILCVVVVSSLVVFTSSQLSINHEPDTYLRVESDKDVYSIGEKVTIPIYFVNNRDTYVELISIDLKYTIYNYWGIGVDGGGIFCLVVGPIRVEPHTEILIFNHLYWGQTTFIYLDGGEVKTFQVPPGEYRIKVTLAYYGLSGSKTIQIIP